MTEELEKSFPVIKGNRSNYFIHGTGSDGKGMWITEEQFKFFVVDRVIESMRFYPNRFHTRRRQRQFALDFQLAVKHLKETGKFPDGAVPNKEATEEFLKDMHRQQGVKV